MTLTHGAILLLTFTLGPAPAFAAGPSPRTMYERTLEREATLRSGAGATAAQVHNVIAAYETLVRKYPASGYCDNALWQAANLALMAAQQYAQDVDRRTAVRLLTQLKTQYPSSSLAQRAQVLLRGLDAAPAPPTAEPVAPETNDAPRTAPPPAGPVLIRDIKRVPIPDGMRVTIEMNAETSFRAERLENPRRVFFDLKGTRAAPSLLDATLKFNDAVVREIRLGRHPQTVTRVVFDMEGVDNYSVFTLYSPYRLVIDFKTVASGAPPAAPPVAPVATLPPTPTPLPTALPIKIVDEPRIGNRPPSPRSGLGEAAPEPARTRVPAEGETRQIIAPPIPLPPPAANADGKFSIARQLGLGVSRIVIDAGHGGHDPGAQSSGLSEAELTLDVAQRLSKLLQKQPGMEVVMTRDTDVFIPLEERTAIANREGADLFLSIHANASRSPRARGVETYFLNFATNTDAEAVAARENSASGRAMHSLPDIVRAIALNNKIDESRDFADMVQQSMVNRLGARNKLLKDLGVKQAPFVVLIGAAMPSVLAEISFVTHRQEGQLLKTAGYRQQIAEALLDAVVKYQHSLKKPRASGVVGLGQR
jgi:N-acetylmuramoyl-L-alanine amidase